MKNLYDKDTYELNSKILSDKLIEYGNNFPNDRVDVNKNQIFVSHEGLLLNYEKCFLRKVEDKIYDLSSHFLWIGKNKG